MENYIKEYIGTKIVKAWPCCRVVTAEGNIEYSTIASTNDPFAMSVEEGYRIQYEDGYLSWSPEDVFEAAYRETTGMPFGLAIEAAKKGKKIARAGWNGKNQYVELAYCISYKNNAAEVINVNHCNIGNKALAFVGTSGVQMGWLASQADMLADDWRIVE